MEMPGRKWQASNYRYSHNGQEKEDEVFSGAQSAEYWMYDSRIGRRWELDPLDYEWQSPYSTFNNNPIYFADPLGLRGDPKGGKKTVKHGSSKGTDGKITKLPDSTIGGSSGVTGNTGSGTSNGNNGTGGGERGKGGAQVVKNAVDKVASFLYKAAKVASYIRVQTPEVKMGVFDPANNPPKYLQRNYYLLAASSLNHANLGNAISNNNYPDRLSYINFDFFNPDVRVEIKDYELNINGLEFEDEFGKINLTGNKNPFDEMIQGRNLNYEKFGFQTYIQVRSWMEIGEYKFNVSNNLNQPIMRTSNRRIVTSIVKYQSQTILFRTNKRITNTINYTYDFIYGGSRNVLDTQEIFINSEKSFGKDTKVKISFPVKTVR